MITNFDFDTTRFIEYSENIFNLYGKQTEAMKKSKLDNIYCKMPMSLFAEIVIGELSNCSNYVGELVIK